MTACQQSRVLRAALPDIPDIIDNPTKVWRFYGVGDEAYDTLLVSTLRGCDALIFNIFNGSTAEDGEPELCDESFGIIRHEVRQLNDTLHRISVMHCTVLASLLVEASHVFEPRNRKTDKYRERLDKGHQNVRHLRGLAGSHQLRDFADPLLRVQRNSYMLQRDTLGTVTDLSDHYLSFRLMNSDNPHALIQNPRRLEPAILESSSKWVRSSIK